MPEVDLRIPDPISLLKLRIDANCEIAREFFETAEVLEKLIKARIPGPPDSLLHDEFARTIRALKDDAWDSALNCVENTLTLEKANASDALAALDKLRKIIKEIGE